jgi:hypothetical protein
MQAITHIRRYGGKRATIIKRFLIGTVYRRKLIGIDALHWRKLSLNLSN